MAVTVHEQNYPGLFEVVISLGLGGAPRNTTYDQIAAILTTIPGVTVQGFGGLRSHEGIWGLNRRAGRFSQAEIAKIKRVAEGIAAKG